MTLTIKGTPHAKVGERDLNCPSNDLSVPDICEPCRQKTRWIERTISWGSKGSKRFKSVLNAILCAHDDVLQEICNFCLASENDCERRKCECFMRLYRSMGLPMRVPVLVGGDKCVRFGTKIEIETCHGPKCYFKECDPQICESCDWRDLDPCNRHADLELARKIFRVEQIKLCQRPTGQALEDALRHAFLGPRARIVGNKPGEIFVDIGGEFTPEDRQLRRFWASRLPAPDGVQITFVRPCR